MTGCVPDDRPYMAAADVYILPIRFGAGVRVKLLNAMSMSCAIVATPAACEGVDVMGGQHLVVAVPTRRLLRHQYVPCSTIRIAGPHSVVRRVHSSPRATIGPFARRRCVRSMPNWSMAMADRRTNDVSLICTMLNEVNTVHDLMESIAMQTVRPREVIVVDGGSRDGTQLHVEWWHGRLGCPLRLIERSGANISTGRNIGDRGSAISDYRDHGCRRPPRWTLVGNDHCALRG